MSNFLQLLRVFKKIDIYSAFTKARYITLRLSVEDDIVPLRLDKLLLTT